MRCADPLPRSFRSVLGKSRSRRGLSLKRSLFITRSHNITSKLIECGSKVRGSESPAPQPDGTIHLANFIEKLKTIADSGEKIEALREFAVHQQTETERQINETILAKEAEKEEAVNAVKSTMGLGTFLCAMTYIETVIEHIYRHDVEICNYWKGERPHKINTDERLNKQIEPHYQKWVGFMHENRSKRHFWRRVRDIVPKPFYMDFAWSMPKMYFVCKDYVQGRRSLSLQRYRTLRASGTKKPLLEYLREHSKWVILKKDMDYVNQLLKAAELDELGYEYLDRHAGLVIPISLEDNCWPPDQFLSSPAP